MDGLDGCIIESIAEANGVAADAVVRQKQKILRRVDGQRIRIRRLRKQQGEGPAQLEDPDRWTVADEDVVGWCTQQKRGEKRIH